MRKETQRTAVVVATLFAACAFLVLQSAEQEGAVVMEEDTTSKPKSVEAVLEHLDAEAQKDAAMLSSQEDAVKQDEASGISETLLQETPTASSNDDGFSRPAVIAKHWVPLEDDDMVGSLPTPMARQKQQVHALLTPEAPASPARRSPPPADSVSTEQQQQLDRMARHSGTIEVETVSPQHAVQQAKAIVQQAMLDDRQQIIATRKRPLSPIAGSEPGPAGPSDFSEFLHPADPLAPQPSQEEAANKVAVMMNVRPAQQAAPAVVAVPKAAVVAPQAVPQAVVHQHPRVKAQASLQNDADDLGVGKLQAELAKAQVSLGATPVTKPAKVEAVKVAPAEQQEAIRLLKQKKDLLVKLAGSLEEARRHSLETAQRLHEDDKPPVGQQAQVLSEDNDAEHASRLQKRMASSHNRLAQLQAHLAHLKARLRSLSRNGDAKTKKGLAEIQHAQSRLRAASHPAKAEATILVSEPAKASASPQNRMEETIKNSVLDALKASGISDSDSSD